MRQLPTDWQTLPRPSTRICSGCNRSLPFTVEIFPVHKRCPWGLDPKCRQCYNAAARVNNKKSQDAIRLKVLSHYGIDGDPACQCCKENRLEFLSLDHVNGGGGLDRKKHGNSQQILRHLIRDGFPSGYRTLCHNCNMSLGVYGYCPHSTERFAHAVA